MFKQKTLQTCSILASCTQCSRSASPVTLCPRCQTAAAVVLKTVLKKQTCCLSQDASHRTLSECSSLHFLGCTSTFYVPATFTIRNPKKCGVTEDRRKKDGTWRVGKEQRRECSHAGEEVKRNRGERRLQPVNYSGLWYLPWELLSACLPGITC